MMTSKLMLGVTLITILLSSCISDMRTALIKEEGITEANVLKGKQILEKAWKKHGFTALDQVQGYEVVAEDYWRGFMGKLGKPWPEARSKMKFKFEAGTFDSQVTFLDGKSKGLTAGLQSWNYYESNPSGIPRKQEINKKIRFGLSAYHYFFEMLHRLKDAPIISWAGEEAFNHQSYDVIFVTWEKTEPHREHDQYKLLINRETGLLDYAIYSLRENYLKMPGGQAFYGSVKFDDYRKLEGLLIPYLQTVFINKPKENIEKHVHQLVVKEFRFNNFDIDMLKPFDDIQHTGNSKTKG